MESFKKRQERKNKKNKKSSFGMIGTMVSLPNGLQANEVLNKMLDVNEEWISDMGQEYKWNIGFDGEYELQIKNPRRNTGFVIKNNPEKKNTQRVFFYLKQIDGDGCQMTHDLIYDIPNNKINEFVKRAAQGLNK